MALIVLLVAFAAGQRALMGLAIFALMVALGHYYYALQSTLLVKGCRALCNRRRAGRRALPGPDRRPHEPEAGHA